MPEPDVNYQTLKLFEKTSTDHHVNIIFDAPISRNTTIDLSDTIFLLSPEGRANISYEKKIPL